MKNKITLLFSGAIAALTFCSCSTFEPTTSLEQALAHVENDIEYHNREFIKKHPVGASMRVPDISKVGKLRFSFGFQPGNNEDIHTNLSLHPDGPQKDVWDAFTREFENAISGSNRFLAAQIRHGLADKGVRKAVHSGTAGAAHFDSSELVKADAIINLVPMLSNSSVSKGNQRTTTYTFKLTCSPVDPQNNSPLPDFQSFSVRINCDINSLTDRFGRTKVGLKFDDMRAGSGANRMFQDFLLRQGRAIIVQFFAHMYKIFPVAGMVSDIDEDGRAVFDCNRAAGLQQNMECVIFAKKKGSESAPVPLYNATVTLLSQTGKSTLQIWRKAETKRALKIIAQVEADFEEAKEEYDFFAAADGFAEWPDFVQQQNTKSGK